MQHTMSSLGRTLYISAWIVLPWLLNACQPMPMPLPIPPQSLAIHSDLLPYHQRLQLRSTDEIRMIVIHCTELPDLASARKYGEKIHYADSHTGNSGHFYIDRDGRIEQYVPIERVAHHVSDHNARSIGIELVNLGRYPDWHHSQKQRMIESYPEPQIAALIALIQHLEQQLPSLEQIAGHEELDLRLMPASDRADQMVPRKRDPGEHFPWDTLMPDIELKRLDPVAQPPED